jgi:hypothetical protein
LLLNTNDVFNAQAILQFGQQNFRRDSELYPFVVTSVSLPYPFHNSPTRVDRPRIDQKSLASRHQLYCNIDLQLSYGATVVFV